MVEHYLKDLAKLKKQKPIFEKVIKVENGIQSQIPRREVKTILNNIGLILSNIYQTSFLLTYYKSLNQIPKNKIKQAEKDQELCIKTYQNILKKLRKIVGRKELHQRVLETQLFHHQMVIRRLDLNPQI